MRAILLIVRRSLRRHALSTAVTALGVALAVGLVMAVFTVSTQSRAAFSGGTFDHRDAILGARGSQLQLVMNTVFHLETSPGNIPWSLYQTVKNDDRVALAIPYAVGDNYRGYRIVGTTPEMFTEFAFADGKRLEIAEGGRVFDPTAQQALVGHVVAARLGLKIGDVIHPYHGIVFDEKAKHDAEYVVVGVMAPSNTPADRVVWIPIEGVFRMPGHALRGAGEVYTAKEGVAIPDEHKEVSAVWLKLKSNQMGFRLDREINKDGRVATLAWPIPRVMAEFFDKLGWMNDVLRLIGYLVAVVAAASILASLTNAMNERRREFAILRALGARRDTVFAAIICEAATIAALGCAIGFAVYFGIVFFAAAIIRRETGVTIDVTAFHQTMISTPVGMIALGALSGLVPALKAYATDVAHHLTPDS